MSEKTVTLTLLESDARRLKILIDAALYRDLQPAPYAEQRLSLEDMIEVFKGLAYSGKEFNVVFRKLDGSLREMRAEVVGVEYNFAKHETYANVIDLDLPEGNNERKIVISRVKFLTTRYRREVHTFRLK